MARNTSTSAPIAAATVAVQSEHEAFDSTRIHIGGIEIKKVVRQHVPLYAGESGGLTMGAMIDKHMEEAALAGEEVQSLSFELTEDYWQSFAKAVHESSTPRY